MRHLSMDIETYSDVDIGKAGLYKYVQSPDFQILLCAYSFDGGPVRVIDLASGEEIPENIVSALKDPGVVKRAYNAAFEWYCLSKFYETYISQWQCTMLHGLYCGYAAGLDAIGKALGLSQDKKKMAAGKALVRYFCLPCKPTKSNGGRTRNLYHHDPGKWAAFKEYCKQDVVSEMEIERLLSGFPVPDKVQRQWECDQMQNAHGVAVDMELVEGALELESIVSSELMQEAKAITGLANPNSAAQLKPWLEENMGKIISNLQKETVAELLQEVRNPKVKRVLEIRRELSKTSIKKYTAMKAAACGDGRIRGLMQFYGANRTGRWAGRLVQVQNLTKNQTEILDIARSLVKARNLSAIKVIFGDVADLLSQLVRTCFIASNGNKIVSADFSAIEARVLAWLADEAWRVENFKKGGDIYCASASQMFGVPVEKHGANSHLRQKGKIAELALGYQGGVGALKQMGALNMGISEEELPDIVRLWRKTNAKIVAFWHDIEKEAVCTLRTGAVRQIKGITIRRECNFAHGQDFLTVELPSGRKLFYVKPFLSQNQFGADSIHYYGMNQMAKKWEVQDTYGGKLTENIVQAIARDCLAEALENLKFGGYRVVFTVHDEAVIDVPEHGSVETICGIMSQPIDWAPGLDLPADGFESPYYKKD